jgi:hypothetical protein
MKVDPWILKSTKMTSRQWKARKRRELRDLKKALHVYRLGCFYTPSKDGEVGQIEDCINSIERAQSVKNWGR